MLDRDTDYMKQQLLDAFKTTGNVTMNGEVLEKIMKVWLEINQSKWNYRVDIYYLSSDTLNERCLMICWPLGYMHAQKQNGFAGRVVM